eukprot:4859669-Amphidinium_carterae.1
MLDIALFPEVLLDVASNQLHGDFHKAFLDRLVNLQSFFMSMNRFSGAWHCMQELKGFWASLAPKGLETRNYPTNHLQ